MKNKKPKYYVGYKGVYTPAILFRSVEVPENNTMTPDGVKFCWGPYSTQRKAEQVAIYQNYAIANNPDDNIPLFPRDFSQEI